MINKINNKTVLLQVQILLGFLGIQQKSLKKNQNKIKQKKLLGFLGRLNNLKLISPGLQRSHLIINMNYDQYYFIFLNFLYFN